MIWCFAAVSRSRQNPVRLSGVWLENAAPASRLLSGCRIEYERRRAGGGQEDQDREGEGAKEDEKEKEEEDDPEEDEEEEEAEQGGEDGETKRMRRKGIMNKKQMPDNSNKQKNLQQSAVGGGRIRKLLVQALPDYAHDA